MAQLTQDTQWEVELGSNWDVLGPFPIHAREQYSISPSFPLDLTTPYVHKPEVAYYSAYADNGAVTWETTRSDKTGAISVSFPNIRWERLRVTDGWAMLQYHAILHTIVTIIPPNNTSKTHEQPRLSVNLSQASFFALLPHEFEEYLAPEWHIGNIYNLHNSCPNSVELPGKLDPHKPTYYDLFVCGDYEIRLYGDPNDMGRDKPDLQFSINVKIEERRYEVVRDKSIDVICDFVGGYAFGDCIGLGFRSIDGWWSVQKLVPARGLPLGVSLSIPLPTKIGPSQRRLLPIYLTQTGPFYEETLKFAIQLTAINGKDEQIHISIPIILKLQHHCMWPKDIGGARTPILATFLHASSQPSHFLAIPPALEKEGESDPNIPILALHGAGVDIFMDKFWVDSLPRQKHHWIIVAVGRSEWGLDWHGPSEAEAWATVRALDCILRCRRSYKTWRIEPSRVILIGHSNGGQGAWYLASRYPDRVAAAIPAAAYLKAQTYVSLTQSRSAHFIDPALRCILEVSFVADDNDLFLSNVVGIPLLAVHGGNDGNVPTWHSRAYIGTALEWAERSNLSDMISYHEDEHMPHWYPNVFSTRSVQQFLSSVLSRPLGTRQSPAEFTLTVADPVSSGSMYGWSVLQLATPGRLGRLHISHVSKGDANDDTVVVHSKNVTTFSVSRIFLRSAYSLIIDDTSSLRVEAIPDGDGGEAHVFRLTASGSWESGTFGTPDRSRRGRVQNILTSNGPLTIVVPSRPNNSRLMSVALRLAHALDVYLRLDCAILTDEQALQKGQLLQKGNIFVIGGSENKYTKTVLTMGFTEFGAPDEYISFRGSPLSDPGIGAMFTHPHPNCRESLILFIIGNSVAALERIFRLFPIRTGIAVPDWVIAGPDTDRLGAAGLIGAGVWSNTWKWNEAMSWYY